MKKRFYDSTPKHWKKIGDALLASGTTLTAYAVVEEMKTLALIALFVTVAGKFVTNIFDK